MTKRTEDEQIDVEAAKKFIELIPTSRVPEILDYLARVYCESCINPDPVVTEADRAFAKTLIPEAVLAQNQTVKGANQ